MPSYLHPGVYIEEIESGAKPIEAVATSTGVFIGYTTKGPLGEVTSISQFDDYKKVFGGIREIASSSQGDPMGFAIQTFYLNGGGNAYVIRLANNGVGDEALSKAVGTLGALLTVTAVNEGSWANDLIVVFTIKDESDSTFSVEIGYNDVNGNLVSKESYEEISFDDDHNLYIEGVLNDISEYVTVSVTDATYDAFANPAAVKAAVDTQSVTLASGSDGNDSVSDNDWENAFTLLKKYSDANIICVPGNYLDKDGAHPKAINEAVSHAETMKNRMVILDPPPGEKFETATKVATMSMPTSTYTALYYPWPEVSNPAFDVEENPGVPKTLLVPPCGFAAGMWAKIDGSRGVWKAPAGVETSLLGASALEYKVSDGIQDVLNPLGVNCLRQIPNYGKVLWGSRTLATKAEPEWRYVPVRRTALFIEQSIFNAIQWAVFEPNNHNLWASLRGSIGSFMDGLFRSGAFQGESASQAYFVRCGLGDTMEQDDIDAGKVIVVVGFAPVKPAEFVIIRIQQKVSSQ